MTSQNGQQIIRKHILSNISSKGHQAIKFNKLIEYNTRNYFFCEKSYTECGGEASPRSYKKPKLSRSLDQQPEI